MLQAKVATEVVPQERMFLQILQNSQENTCARIFFFIKKETLAQVISCEFCEIFKNTFSTEHLGMAASIQAKDLELNPFHTTGFFLYHLKNSGIEKDHSHDMA